MKIIWLIKNLRTIVYHKYCVFIAGRQIGGIPIWRLLIHDWTKLLPSEFPYYARQFQGDGLDKIGFANCWLKHQNRNPHHWEYWIPRTKSSKDYNDNEPLPMPDVFIREMVADWMGAGRAYSGKWPNVSNWDWLNRNMHRMRLHKDTINGIFTILDEFKNKVS